MPQHRICAVGAVACVRLFSFSPHILLNKYYKMKYLHTLLVAALLTPAVALAEVQTPSVYNWSDYAGSSFMANWEWTQGQDYLLSVYTTGDESTTVTEDFASINQTNGKINTENPNLPEGWNINVTANGTTDMVFYNGCNHLLLDADGDAVTNGLIIGGNLDDLVLNANIVNADGIVKDNSSVFVVEIFDKQGNSLTSGRIEALYFAARQDFSVKEAFRYVPANIGMVKLSIEKTDGHNVGDIAINSITYSYKTPEYVIKDKAFGEDDTMYEVTGLDPEHIYYYYVRGTKDGATSPVGSIMRVDGFLPAEALAASGVTSTSFTANWKYLPKAMGYTLQPYRYDVTTEDGLVSVLSDTFSKATEGTYDAPVSVTNPDEVADTEGWTGKNILAAEGMLGANSGRFPMNLAYLHSPQLNLAANGGKYTVKMKAYGKPGDYISVYRVGYMIDTNGDGQPDALNIHKTSTFGEDGWLEDEWEMTDGVSDMTLSFEENKMAKFFIDEITISQEHKAGEVNKIALDPIEIADGKTTSYTFDNLTENGLYGYTVTGKRTDEYGTESYSDESDEVKVQLTAATSISTAESTAPVFRASAGAVSVTLSEAATIQLYDAAGQLLTSVAANAGTTLIPLYGKGVFVVKVAGKTFKVANK